MMRIFDSLAGSVRIELTSADISETLQIINRMRIPVSDLQMMGDLTAQFTIPRYSLKQIEVMAERKGSHVSVLSKKGIYWMILGLRLRPVMLFGLVVLLFLSVFVPSRVLFVQVEGNKRLATNLVLEAAYDVGIRFCAVRRSVRSEKIKNELMDKLPQLQWVGVNTYGCVAVISVRERSLENEKEDAFSVSNVVASCDGVITSCTITRGVGVCTVGEAVRSGQVLISGYNDCGGIITAGRAEGEVFAETRHKIEAVTLSNRKIRTVPEVKYTNFSLRVGKKRINFFKGSGISDSSCVKMVTQYDLALPGSYILPITFLKEEYVEFRMQTQPVNAVEAASWLSEFAKSLVRNEGVALSVLNANESITSDERLIRLRGIYACNEMIGREQGEQIGDFHGKTN